MNFTESTHNSKYSAVTAQQDGRLRQAQLKMLAILETVDAICLKHNLDYWLEGGTLLGAVRHKGFIPWDDDLDISMPRASYEKFLRIAPSEIPESMWLQTPETDPGYFNLSVPLKIRDKDSLLIELHEDGSEPYQQGIFIDVFVYDGMSADPIQRKSDQFRAKKWLRLLSHKYSTIGMGHYSGVYAAISKLISKTWLEDKLRAIIHRANNSNYPFMGYGYDCVNSNLVAYSDIYPLKRHAFETGLFNVANKSDVILTQLYGDYMILPPESSRQMKHCRELVPYLSDVSA